MNILIACEESQVIANLFRENGFNAFSCDIQECSGGRPEWHIHTDCLKIINGFCEFWTQDGKYHYFPYKWDLIIAHPPCTYLTVTGNKWFKPEYAERFPNRQQQRDDAIKFFMDFVNADCEHIAIENPVGVMSTKYRKPDQYIQPYYFGDADRKKTGLWLKGLPLLKPTKFVEPELVVLKSGKTMSKAYSNAWSLTPEERSKVRSKTYNGIAKAMVEQWGKYLKGDLKNDN